jgi:2-methylcitrate dehydratase
MSSLRVLPADSNQARGISQYAIDFCRAGLAQPSNSVWQRLEAFHLDSVACGLSALVAGTRAPTVLRHEALDYPLSPSQSGAYCYGSTRAVHPEKAVLANCSAVREWDANGTNFGYAPERGAMAGEFGHNDFYPVALAAVQMVGGDGHLLRSAMLCLDEIRGRLAEVFALRRYAIDHVVHGAIASAAVYGAVLGAGIDQIESAIGLVVAHAIPFRAIRAGHQLSDSKGASAAIAAEASVAAVHRAVRGFVGPADIFRNPQAIFCYFQPPSRPDASPFDLSLAVSGDQFAVMDMHFKLGLYEHQSAGAVHGLLELLAGHPELLDKPHWPDRLEVSIYQPAFGIIGDPAKRDPRTRQSADHSLFFILASLLHKALRRRTTNWEQLMLMPDDYQDHCFTDPQIRGWMDRIHIVHGGGEFDKLYPQGIPTQVRWMARSGGVYSSPLVLFPKGHARNTDPDVPALLAGKFDRLVGASGLDPDSIRHRFGPLHTKSAGDIAQICALDLPGMGNDRRSGSASA